MKKKKKGSMAIEATIAFTVFICFMFLLMSIAKLSMVYITINDVTSESAKKIAGMSYPISYVNDFVDDGVETLTGDFKTNATKLTEKSSDGKTNILQYMGIELSSGILTESGIQDILTSVQENIVNMLTKALFEFKTNAQTELAANVYMDLLDNTHMPVNKDAVTVQYFSLPISETEFDVNKAAISEATGIAQEDLNRDDVILYVTYDYEITVPFFPAYDITLKSIAVERAWLDGGNHVTPSKREGIDITELMGRQVFYTSSGKGKKYHKETCFTLKISAENNNKKSTSITQARAMGLEPCKLCKPDEADADKED